MFPLTAFFEAPKESTALEIVTIFLNAGTFLVVAIVAGGLAERFRSTQAELETEQTNLQRPRGVHRPDLPLGGDGASSRWIESTA